MVNLHRSNTRIHFYLPLYCVITQYGVNCQQSVFDNICLNFTNILMGDVYRNKAFKHISLSCYKLLRRYDEAGY